MTKDSSAKPASAHVARKRMLIGLCGTAMMLTQYVAVREVGSTFFSTELVTLMAVVMALIGPSLAYGAVHRFGAKFVTGWGAVSVATALLLPVAVRYLVGTFAAFEVWILLLVLALGSLFLCGWFALFLPQMAEADEFPVLYALEVGGAFAALCLIALAPGWHALLCLYWALLVAVVHFALRRIIFTTLVLSGSFAMALMYASLDDSAARRYYQGHWKIEEAQLIDTVYSPYQRVDVVQSRKGRGLYLDGVPYYSKGDLDWFNIMIAEVPGKLYARKITGPPEDAALAAAQPLPPLVHRSALIVGSGSFGSSGRLKALGYDVTVVELDAQVARIGFKDFQDVHGLKEGEVKVVIDDARHYLSTVPEGTYDLVVLDLPAPFHVQTALLYTPDFYRQVQAALKPGGIASLNLCSTQLTDEVGGSIARSAADVFANVTAVKSNSNAELWLIYASDNPPFNASQVYEALAQTDPRGGRVVSDRQVRLIVRDRLPHSQDRLLALLFIARSYLPGGR